MFQTGNNVHTSTCAHRAMGIIQSSSPFFSKSNTYVYFVFVLPSIMVSICTLRFKFKIHNVECSLYSMDSMSSMEKFSSLQESLEGENGSSTSSMLF